MLYYTILYYIYTILYYTIYILYYIYTTGLQFISKSLYKNNYICYINLYDNSLTGKSCIVLANVLNLRSETDSRKQIEKYKFELIIGANPIGMFSIV